MAEPTPQHDYRRVPTSKAMVGDTVWNLVGMGLPLVAGALAFLVLPDEEHGLGAKRLEVLGLVWMLVGFSSIFDLGLGRALTKLFADRLSQDRRATLPALFWTALTLIVGLGIVAAILVVALIPVLSGGDMDEDLRRETVLGLWTVALSMPVMIVNVGLCGVLQASRAFKLLNIIRIPSGSYTFLAPVCVLPFSKSIFVVVLVLILGRSIEMVAYFVACLRTVPELRQRMAVARDDIRELIGFGGWMTVSNITVSFMTHVNRFVIRSVRKIGEGAYYLVPEEIAIRMLLVPRAWIDVLFPAFVTSFNSPDEDPTRLFRRGVNVLTLMTMAIALPAAVFLPDVLSVWLPEGEVYATRGRFVIRCLVIGVFIHGVARVIWYFVQAAGRPDLAARMHLVQLPIYLGGAYFLISSYGIDGAAIAWTTRVTIDLLLLAGAAARFLTNPRAVLGHALVLLAGAATLIALAALPHGFFARIGTSAVALVVFYVAAWHWVLSADERGYVAKAGASVRRKLQRRA